MCVYDLCVDTHAITCIYGLQNTFMESVLAFDLYMGSRDRTQVTRLWDKCLYPPSHLADPQRQSSSKKTILGWVEVTEA